MSAAKSPLLSIVVPLFNEAEGLRSFHETLTRELLRLGVRYEIIYCDDGSRDATAAILQSLADNAQVRSLVLTRNFGKEVTLSAGIAAASGEAILTIDGDGQHPVELIGGFVAAWQAGAPVVVGLRRANQNEGFIKRYGSKLFYGIFSRFTGMKLTPGATDFRLIDRTVQKDFLRLTEHSRIIRGLIDWLGYTPVYINFTANAREHGSAGYSLRKLVRLAIDSTVSLSPTPLYFSAYLGAVVLPLASLLGIGMGINWLAGDPLSLHATGTAYVAVLLLFLVGILLTSQGIIGLYLSRLYDETKGRPLYVINEKQSRL